MKILHIVNETPAKNVLDLIELQRKAHDVEVININVEQPDYDAIIDQVINSDRVISWSNVHEVAR
jgi:NAD-dependent SIR2 family protein deacetylase